MTSSNRRLAETGRTQAESSRHNWLDNIVQTRSASFLEAVRQSMGDAWMFVCQGSELRGPGDFLTDEVAGRLVLLCRNADGELKALFNVCPHLGAPVERMRHGTTRSFSCPYHGWTFSLDGKLIGTPLPEGYANTGFRRDDYRLPPLSAISAGGLVFVSLAGKPSGPGEFFDGIMEPLTGLFPAGDKCELVANYSLYSGVGWDNWLQKAYDLLQTDGDRIVFGSSPTAPAARPKLIETAAGHRALYLASDKRGDRSDTTLKSAAQDYLARHGLAVCLLFMRPNLLVIASGSALISVRADPLDDGCSVLRIRSFAPDREPDADRRIRLDQFQRWCGELSKLQFV
ncbi:MAG: Rieske (2Fe-2S) protein [Candidatus Binataceae bacterium]|nr:Rieske (2Fe-2S) protein [Candidatus Binataceae bacterium]